jgi:uncharacterized membrane protein
VGSMNAEPGHSHDVERRSANSNRSRNRFHLIFEIGVLAKGIDGAFEFIGGVLLLFLSPDAIWRVGYYLIQDELIEDPSDPFANWVLNFVPKVIETKFSASGFLLIHGIVKLGLVAGLATNRLWSYPVGIVVFGAFTVYQVYELAQKHSAFFAVVTVLDVLVIFLIAIEYQHVRRAKKLN